MFSFTYTKLSPFIELNVIKVEEGSVVTADYRTDRVRVFYDKDGKVSSKPSIG